MIHADEQLFVQIKLLKILKKLILMIGFFFVFMTFD
jgi:hypothetical protein